MAKFIPNPEVKNALQQAFTDFTYEIFYLMQLIINTPRYWDDWETSDPFRDIVDTGRLRDSGKVQFSNNNEAEISWATEYVGFVYFGYTLKSGRRIPPRKWIEMSDDENDFTLIWTALVLKHLGI